MVADALRWTVRDLDVLPDDGGWKRYEIVDGELYVTRAPHLRHQGASGNLHFELEVWSRRTQMGKPFQAPGIVFSPTDAVIPDVVWMSQARLANSVDDAGHLTAAPEIVAEVLSPGELNQRRDREVKLKLYSRHGVQEYWLLDWQQQTLAIYRRDQAQLRLTQTLSAGDVLTSPRLPGFSVLVNDIFK
jgi:Uma2 family endonuclease